MQNNPIDRLQRRRAPVANNQNNANNNNQNNNNNNAQGGQQNAAPPQAEFQRNRLHLNEMRRVMELAGINNQIILMFRAGELPTLEEIERVGPENIYNAIIEIDVTADWGMIPILDLIANNQRNGQAPGYAGPFAPLNNYFGRAVVWNQVTLLAEQAGPLFERIRDYQDFRPNAVLNAERLNGVNIVAEVAANYIVLQDGHIIDRAAADVVVPEIPAIQPNLVAGALFGHAYYNAPTAEDLFLALNIEYSGARLAALRARVPTFQVLNQNYLCIREDLILAMNIGQREGLGNVQFEFLAEPNRMYVAQRAMPMWLAPEAHEGAIANGVQSDAFVAALVQRAPLNFVYQGEIQDFIARYYGWLQGPVVIRVQQILRAPQRAQYNIMNALNACLDIAGLIVCIASVAVNLQPRMAYPNIALWENMNMVVIDEDNEQHIVTVREAAAAIFGHAQRNNAQACIPFIALINNTLRQGPFVDYVLQFNFYCARGEFQRAFLEDLFNNYVVRLQGGRGARRRLQMLLNRIVNFVQMPIEARQIALAPWIALILRLQVGAPRNVVLAAIGDFFHVPRLGVVGAQQNLPAIEPGRAPNPAALAAIQPGQARRGMFGYFRQ